MKLDFVFQSNVIENGFDLLSEFGKRAVIGWSEPLIFGFPPKSFRQIQMRRIFRQKEDVQILFHPSRDRRQELFRPMGRRIV